jgi:hypothetical protein
VPITKLSGESPEKTPLMRVRVPLPSQITNLIMETIQNLDHLVMAIYLITVILGLIAVILAGFLLINEKRKHPWEK